MIDVGMGYVGAKTNPGRVTNVVFDGLYGIGPTGNTMNAHGLPNASGCPGCDERLHNITLRNISLQTGGAYACSLVDGVVVEGVQRWPRGSTCAKGVGGGSIN